MSKLLSEPLMVIIAGGTVLVQALMQMLVSFGIPITAPQQNAIMTVAGILLPLCARQFTVPTSALPPGVANQIADAKAVKAAEAKG